MHSFKLYSIYIQLIIANILWGFSFVWTDIVLKEGIAPITLVLSRMVISTVLLGLWAKIAGNLQKIQFVHLKFFLGLAMCEPFLYFLGETYGQTMVSPTVTSIIVATIPLFSPLVGYFVMKEKIYKGTIIGIFISLAGVLAVVTGGKSSFSGQFLGAALVFGAVISAIGYACFIKYLVKIYNASTIVFYQNAIALLYFIPCFFIVDYKHISEMNFTFTAISSLIQLSVFASVIAFLFYSRAVKALGITITSIFCYIIPVLTALFAFFAVDERLTVWQWTGMAVVIAGLFISGIVFEQEKRKK
jgi:drug/metabolite transporter (DMT)-like permease